MLDVEEVRKDFTYDPLAGELRWTWRGVIYNKHWLAGELAGYVMKKGGRRVTFYKGKLRYNTLLIWLIVFGRDAPQGYVIDHKDENPGNDKLENLQEISKGKNYSKSYEFRKQRYHASR